jgi:hypothetical protein
VCPRVYILPACACAQVSASSSQPASVVCAMDDIVGTLEEFLGTLPPVLPEDAAGDAAASDADAATNKCVVCLPGKCACGHMSLCSSSPCGCRGFMLPRVCAPPLPHPLSALRGRVVATSLITHIALSRGTVTALLRGVEALQGLGKAPVPLRHRVEDVWGLQRTRGITGPNSAPRHVLVCGQNG